jgi:glycosyltransferase involved in cell wall biosynthesis
VQRVTAFGYVGGHIYERWAVLSTARARGLARYPFVISMRLMSTPSSPQTFTFTVFTGTRNRAHTLGRVYDSLKAQTFHDFEWLIVDNESTDGTPELVAGWQREAPFPIRYIYHANRGKHGSQNRAISEAQGELFLTLDSDDSCPPYALERLRFHWESVPLDMRQRFTGVSGHTSDEHGITHGTPFPFDPTDSDSLEIRFKYKVKGENWGFHRTDVMREFPLPEIEGYTGLVPSSVAWNAIARKYKTRYVNETLKTWSQDQPTSLSRPANELDFVPGELIATREMLNHNLRWLRYDPWTFYIYSVFYTRNALHSGLSLWVQGSSLTSVSARLLWLAGVPAGFVLFLAERQGVAQFLPGLRHGRSAIAWIRRTLGKATGARAA